MRHQLVAVVVAGIALVGMALVVGDPSVCRAQSSVAAKTHAEQVAEREIRAIFGQRFRLAFNETSLREVVNDLRIATGVEVFIDDKSLMEAGIYLNQPITCDLGNTTLYRGLDLMLKQVELTWLIEGDCIVITTTATAMSHMESRVYPVLDLVVVDRGSHYTDDYDSLLELITASIHPTTWTAVGGVGSVEPFSGGGSIVVSQTREVHDQLELLLESLRQARDTQGLKPRLQGYQAPPQTPIQRQVPPAYQPTTYATPGISAAWQVPRVFDE